MKTYEVDVSLKISIDAFTLDDARDAVIEDLNDFPGATVIDIHLVDIKQQEDK